MSITQYTNFDRINQKLDNEGKFIQDKDAFILSNNEIEDTDFGDCKYDVMEVSVYDINNNLLPQKSGNTVAYIKTGDIKNYLLNVTNNRAKKELAIDIEKLLGDLGFTNGILRVNINFVRNRVGTDDASRRVWVQAISPSRSEIRILPLKVSDQNITSQNIADFNNLQNLNKDFKYYKKSILDSLYSFENTFLDSINSTLESKYGKDFFNILRVDFGLRNFNEFRKRIYDDFKTSVEYYLTNKYYWVNEGNYGRPSGIRFEDCEQYDFDMIVKELEKILFRCIEVNTGFLKRRDFDVKETPIEFKEVELDRQVQDNLTFFETPIKQANIVYSPENVSVLPTQPPPTIAIEEPGGIIPIPSTIELPVTDIYFSYYIKNNSSLRSLVFTFTDVTGTTVQKILSAGQTATVCALENSVSVDEINPLFNSNVENKLEFTINKLKNCKTKDIGISSPSSMPTPTPIPREEAEVGSAESTGLTAAGLSDVNIAQNMGDVSTGTINPIRTNETLMSIPTVD
ncbi:hypothetical protein UFOVP449_71 [uncultured Caudovirales phage]|uniref:Uncharacterized protein n=1 Tax=uncultured Caudovirales phage TaxID=2100421 RepID=A0A6J5MG40_9CAUD|nr:hypothetical protein UFOVP449_71 [uncultured Caudovirales phage]